jgi:hypothetical protein
MQTRPPQVSLLSGSCSSDRDFASGFLQIPRRRGHPCLRLVVPTTKPTADFHRQVIAHAGRTCRAHIKKPSAKSRRLPFLFHISLSRTKNIRPGIKCSLWSFAPLLRTNPCNKAPMDFCILRIGTSNTSDLVSMYIIYLNVTLSIVNCLTIPSDYGASFCASSARVMLLMILSATSGVKISSSTLCNRVITYCPVRSAL